MVEENVSELKAISQMLSALTTCSYCLMKSKLGQGIRLQVPDMRRLLSWSIDWWNHAKNNTCKPFAEDTCMGLRRKEMTSTRCNPT